MKPGAAFNIPGRFVVALGALTFMLCGVAREGVAAPPFVQSIRGGEEAIHPGIAGFLIWFSEPVTGVDLADFVLSSTGLTGAQMQTAVPLPQIRAFEIDSLPGYAISTDRAGFQVPGALTVEAWIYPQDQTAYAAVVSNVFDSGVNESGYGILMDGGSGIYFALKTTTSAMQYFASGPGTIFQNRWQHVACTYDGTDARIYINGVIVQTYPVTGTALDYDPPNDFTVGRFQDSDEIINYFGLIADVRIWSVARNADEVPDDQFFPLVGDEPGLVANYIFAQFEDLGVSDNNVDDIRDESPTNGRQNLDFEAGAQLGEAPVFFYGVVASTGTLDGATQGSLTLSLIDDDTIVNQTNEPLGGLGPFNGDYNGGPESTFMVTVDRSSGDFDGSGCTNVVDFLFLIDNWQMVSPLGGPAMGVEDFLSLIDNWQMGSSC